MCEFCTRHGEGKKWYENMENYSKEVFSRVNSKDNLRKYLRGFRKRLSFLPYTAYRVKKLFPGLYDSLVYPRVTSHLKKTHFGQVVPLEDAFNIVERVHSIVRLPCVCRKVTRGKEYRYCLGVGMDLREYVQDVPDFQNFDLISREKAKKLLNYLEGEGMVHSIWTFGTPFIGAICNCDRDCMAYNVQVKFDIAKAMWKGEYVAQIDPFLCNGCRQCMKQCIFQGVEYDMREEKCRVNIQKCYGCGICRKVCKKEALNLQDRYQVMGSQAVW